ncbi:VOC family protein [Bacillus sp. FSL K6-3431]|uniref:VOC family protein n=1 Tax=Bacillus sp. FSL K6-3431 TaxID=2921500 RepID=UPI0030F7EC18
MIKVLGLHHLSIAITNLEKSKLFYGEILGLQELPRPNFDFEGAWYQIGTQQIHLIVFPHSKTLRNCDEINTIDSHIALQVQNYQETLDYLRNHDVPVIENTGTKSGLKQIFCLDPDQNIIELNLG